MAEDRILLLPLWYVVFLLSVTCHEAGHAWAARLGGDDTAYLGGQVSLNPLPHIQREVWGTVLVPLISYLWVGWMMGWASAPYDPAWEERHPRRAAAAHFRSGSVQPSRRSATTPSKTTCSRTRWCCRSDCSSTLDSTMPTSLLISSRDLPTLPASP